MPLRLSIVIPVFKVEKYLDQCLQSIFNSDEERTDLEVILVNDGSPDRSIDIARRFAQKHPSMRILEQENQGLSAARMNGLASAQGEYVWFVDADDFLLSGGLEKVLSAIVEDPNTDVFVSPLLWVYESKEKNRLDIPNGASGTNSGKYFLRNHSFFCWAAQRYIIRRSLFNYPFLLFPQGLLHEDEYFGRVLLYSAKTVRVLSESVYAYRQREGSIISTRSIRSSYDIVSVYFLLAKFMDTELQEIDKGWFTSQIIDLLCESYTSNQSLFGTPDFKRFMNDNRPRIVKEYRKRARQFPLWRKMSDIWLFYSPKTYIAIIPLVYKWGIGRSEVKGD